MYELWASENEGWVLLQHKVCISVACEICCPIWASIVLMKYGSENMEKIMLHKPVTVLLLLFIFFHSYEEICELQYLYLLGTKPLYNVQTLYWSKTSPSFTCAHSSCIYVPFLYHKSACTSGSKCRKRIYLIARYCAIVSHFVRGTFPLPHSVYNE